MKSICVFCGANFNGDALIAEAVDQLAQVMVSSNMALVFGGGRVGVMGMIADAVIKP